MYVSAKVKDSLPDIHRQVGDFKGTQVKVKVTFTLEQATTAQKGF
jgi:hypothetical protein